MAESELNKKNLKLAHTIIGVIAGKGGVGKSTIAVELARTLTKEGYKVGLLDADIYGPSTRHLLKEEILPRIKDDYVLPAIAEGISIMSIAYFPKGDTPSIVRAPIANQFVIQFIEEVDWENLDILLIDFPPGTGDIQLTLMQRLIFQGMVAVTTPQDLSLLDVRKSIKMCLQLGAPLLGIIENMSYFSPLGSSERYTPFGEGGGEKLAEEFHLPFLAAVPIDMGLSDSKYKKISTPIFDSLGKKIMMELRDEKRCKIKGEDRYHFSIEWQDGKKSLYRYYDVQKSCLCVSCTEKKDVKSVVDVEGLEISCVGNYGVKFLFSSGCSKGIYPFTFLRALDR